VTDDSEDAGKGGGVWLSTLVAEYGIGSDDNSELNVLVGCLLTGSFSVLGGFTWVRGLADSSAMRARSPFAFGCEGIVQNPSRLLEIS
jgi:hypothetical protein